MEVGNKTRIIDWDVSEVHFIHCSYLPAYTSQNKTYATAACTGTCMSNNFAIEESMHTKITTKQEDTV